MKLFNGLGRSLYQSLIKPIFFQFDPESVHDFITSLGYYLGKHRIGRSIVASCFDYENLALEQEFWGLKFKNPVGLAAGFDKDGKLYAVMSSVGFGFSTVGTATLDAYEGNPKPRLYRLLKSKGLVVYYGLKNIGSQKIAVALKKKPNDMPQVISIGRTNSSETATVEAGIEDYRRCLEVFIKAEVGDIYEINISCPNLFCGASFAEEANLRRLLECLFTLPIRKPVFIKMPINLPWSEFKKLLDVVLGFKVQAVVIGNLNKNRRDPNIKEDIPEYINGSVSGKPTKELSNNLISETYRYCGQKLKIVGVGGIASAEEAYEKIRRGASIVELITGLIYEGPQLIGEINKGLTQLLKRDGYKNINEAVGTSS
jgi:dihydroorotate dehydrogenase subfamily 2